MGKSQTTRKKVEYTYGSSQVVTTDESFHLSAEAYLTANLTADEDTVPVAVPSGVVTVVPDELELPVARVQSLVYLSTRGNRQRKSKPSETVGRDKISVFLLLLLPPVFPYLCTGDATVVERSRRAAKRDARATMTKYEIRWLTR